MRRFLIVNLVSLVCLLSPAYAWAQQQKKEFETSGNEGFLKRSSFIGKDSPDVEVYDADGIPFRLAQSRGKHTVVVFGCLT